MRDYLLAEAGAYTGLTEPSSSTGAYEDWVKVAYPLLVLPPGDPERLT